LKFEFPGRELLVIWEDLLSLLPEKRGRDKMEISATSDDASSKPEKGNKKQKGTTGVVVLDSTSQEF
jgi:hypothetical protein